MKKALITGVTGFVMSHIACMLIREGYQVYCLARNRRDESARQRIAKALNFVDSSIRESDYKVIEGDITKPNLGIINPQIMKVQFDEFWHGAASISFKDEDEENTHKVNVDGTQNVLNFVSAQHILTIRYFSTAYVCGRWKKTRFFETDLDCGQQFKNPYEATKFEAEKLVHKFQKQYVDKAISIYRLGIVVGNSKTGKASNFSGYYALAKMFYSLKKFVIKEMQRNPVKCLKSGFCVTSNGNGHRDLLFPVKIPCHPYRNINLVTVDYVTDVICQLAGDKKNQGIFHIVNQDPPTIQWLFDVSLKFLGLSGFYPVPINDKNAIVDSLHEVAKSEFLRDIELSIWKMCGAYIPYLTGEPVFDDFRTRSVTMKTHPEITEQTIGTLLGYAVKTDFGRFRRKVKKVKDVAMTTS